MNKVNTIPKPDTNSNNSLEPTAEEKELMRTLDQRELTYIGTLNKVGKKWKYEFLDIANDNKKTVVQTQIEPRNLPVTFKYRKDYCIPFLPIKGKERFRNIADRFIELIYELPDREEVRYDVTSQGDYYDRMDTINSTEQQYHSSVSDDKPSKDASSMGPIKLGSQSLTEPTNKLGRLTEYTILNTENIIKYLNPDATEQQAFMFLQLCKNQNLDPFVRDAYLIIYGGKASMVVSKDAFLKKAEEQTDYEGFEAGIIIKDQDDHIDRLRQGSFIMKGETLLGGWAKVYRKGLRPFYAEVSREEYDQKRNLWATKPATMIRKVAIVQAMREAFPSKFQGMYDRAEIEEMN